MSPSAVHEPIVVSPSKTWTDENGYTILEKPLGTRRPIRILVIGFGASAINLSRVFGLPPDNNIEIQCYDKNPELGGTWYENTYPGCACDIPSVNYQYTWHPKPDWTNYYSGSAEILGYFKDVVKAHGLGRFAKLNHRVMGAWWNDESGKWKIKVQPGENPDDSFFDHGDVLINATGVLNAWKWPTIPGIEKFKLKEHSAAWDHSISLDDKVVGVIGNGSSAIQIVPAIFPKVKSLKTFMRSSTWITAGFAQKYAGENGANFKYSEEQKKFHAENPEEYLKYRKGIETELNRRFPLIINGTKEQREALEFSRAEMSAKLRGNAALIDKLVPKNYAIGCRRPTPGNGYLEAISDTEKCQVVFDKIREITENGIVTEDGIEHKMDVLVCATGFDNSWRPRYPTCGKNGVEMKDVWKEFPETYLSLTAPQFPNYFMMNGPFGPYGHGAILPVMEVITRHVEKIVLKMQTEDIKSFMPSQRATDDFKRHRELFLKRTAWSSPCRSWFKLGKIDGPIMMWPGSRLHMFHVMENPRWEDYEWEWLTQDRFSFWGNGFSIRESDGTDLSYYINGIP